MGRALTPTPCCSYAGLNKGPWTREEDLRLIKYIEAYGEGNWRTVPRKAGLLRCGKGCRLRWMNYLRPNVKRGHISPDEEEMIIRLHNLLGNRWSLIAGRIPGRTDNEVKNYWNNHLRKKFNPIKGFTRNARAVGGKQPGFEQVARAKTICGGTVNPLCMNGKRSSFSPYKDASSTVHAVKDENSASASWDIREIVNILMGDEDRCNRTEYVAIEDFKQSIDGFHDDMDLNTSIINHNHIAWPHGNNHESSMPIIYSPDFQTCKTCPSDCMARGGLYQQYSMSASFSSMGQQGYKIFSATINSEEKPTGDASNLQPKTIAEAQIQTHIRPYELIQEDDFRDIDCDVFDQFSINIASPELGEYMSLKSCLQPQDPTANQCSETWLSSFNWFDCIQQLEY